MTQFNIMQIMIFYLYCSILYLQYTLHVRYLMILTRWSLTLLPQERVVGARHGHCLYFDPHHKIINSL